MARSRDKGARGELEVRNLFRGAGYTAERGQQRHGGPDSPDVRLPELPWLHPEVKLYKRLQITRDVYGALDQAARDKAPDQMAVGFVRQDRCRWLVALEPEDFFRLVREYEP